MPSICGQGLGSVSMSMSKSNYMRMDAATNVRSWSLSNVCSLFLLRVRHILLYRLGIVSKCNCPILCPCYVGSSPYMRRVLPLILESLVSQIDLILSNSNKLLNYVARMCLSTDANWFITHCRIPTLYRAARCEFSRRQNLTASSCGAWNIASQMRGMNCMHLIKHLDNVGVHERSRGANGHLQPAAPCLMTKH